MLAGMGSEGQLGGGRTVAAMDTPVEVSGGHTFVSVSAGGQHTEAIEVLPSGKAYCWGVSGPAEGGIACYCVCLPAIPSCNPSLCNRMPIALTLQLYSLNTPCLAGRRPGPAGQLAQQQPGGARACVGRARLFGHLLRRHPHLRHQAGLHHLLLGQLPGKRPQPRRQRAAAGCRRPRLCGAEHGNCDNLRA